MIQRAPAEDTLLGRPTPAHPPAFHVERVDLLLSVATQMILSGRFAASERLLRQILERDPSQASAWSLLASTAERIGDVDEALACFERAMDLAPPNTTLLSNYIFAHDRHPGRTLADALAARRRYNELVAVEPRAHPNDRDPERRLRVGYVSGDFHHHSAAFGFGPILLNHTDAFDLYAYDNHTASDALTDALRERIPNWRQVAHLDDAALDALIRADEIDVLVDLSGHSSGNRLPVFARKPAPIQVTAWGYITGTGLDAMDYLFADDVTVPPEDEPFYAESVWRLPRIMPYLAAPPDRVGEVSAPPADTNGYLTLGVYQRLGKLKPDTIALWSRVLDAVPDARLLVKASGLEDEATRLRVEARFREAGADLTRVAFHGASGHWPHMRAYDRIDLALDPWPDGGGISTLEAAWMGVPTLTAPWRQIPSRFTASLNSELGLPWLTVRTPSEYVARVVEIDQQREALGEVRRLMRDLMTSSAFCNPALYLPPVEAAYREMWRRHCTGTAPTRLRVVA